MLCIKVQIAVGGIAYHKTSQQFTTYHIIPSQPVVFESGCIFVHPINNFAIKASRLKYYRLVSSRAAVLQSQSRIKAFLDHRPDERRDLRHQHRYP